MEGNEGSRIGRGEMERQVHLIASATPLRISAGRLPLQMDVGPRYPSLNHRMVATNWEGCNCRGQNLLPLRLALQGPTAEDCMPTALPTAGASLSLKVDPSEEPLSISGDFSELQFPHRCCMRTGRSDNCHPNSTVLKMTLPHSEHGLSLLTGYG